MNADGKLLGEKGVFFWFQTPGIICCGQGNVREFYLAKSVDKIIYFENH